MSRRRLVVVLTALTIALCAQARRASCQSEPPGPAPAPAAGPFSGLAESPRADLFTGTATTAIRFQVPPGRMDMTPDLALTYSSQGAQGAYGFGWSLPIGRISRSLRDGVPEYFNQRDEFVLELPGRTVELVRVGEPGSKRYRAKYEGSYLRIVFENDGADYWRVFDKNGTVYTFGKDPGQRHSRIDRFSGMFSDGTYAWMLESVEDAFANRIDYFYQPPFSGETNPRGLPERIEYGGRKNKTHPFVVGFSWGQLGYPVHPRTSYKTGCLQYSGDRYLAAVRSYIDGGAELVREYVLDYEQETGSSGSFTLVGVSLRAHAAGGSFVDVPPTVFRYAPAIQTGWPTGPTEQRRQYAVEFEGPGEIHDHGTTLQFETFDINGDGLPDYVDAAAVPATVRFGTGSGLEAPVAWAWPPSLPYVRRTTSGRLRAAVLDMTGDGLPDLVYSGCGTSADRRWCIYKNNGAGFNLVPELWAAPLGRDYLRRTDPAGSSTSLLTADTLDLSGDGRPDFVDTSVYSSGDPSWWVVRNLGDGFENGYIAIHAPGPSLATYVDQHTTCQSGWQSAGLLDMNGDGIKDYVLADTGASQSAWGCNGEDHWDVYFNTGGSFEPQAFAWRVEGSGDTLPFYLNTFVGCSNEPFSIGGNVLDLTGDGRSDLVLPDMNVCGGSQSVPLNCDPGGCDLNDPEYPGNCCNNWGLMVNTGSSFSAPIGWASPHLGFVSRFSYPAAYNTTRYEMIDFDGDGLLDLLEHKPRANPVNGQITGHTWRVYRNPASPFASGSSTLDADRSKPNLLVSMMNGIGGETMLEYTPASLLGDSRCSYDGEGRPVAGNCMPFPYWTLTRRETLDVLSTFVYGRSEPRVDNYVYQGSRYDGVAREFRGFATVSTVDPLGISHTSEYHQDDARKGLIHDAWVLGNPGCGTEPPNGDAACNPWNYPLSHVHNDWPDVQSDPSRALLLERETTTPYALSSTGGVALARTDLTETVSYSYDAYGNQAQRSLEYTAPHYSDDGLRQSISRRIITESQYDLREQVSADGVPLLYNVVKPLRILSYESGEPDRNLLEKVFTYRKGLLRSTSVCRQWDSAGNCIPGAWADDEYRMYKSGLVKTVRTALGGTRSARYDKQRLYAGRRKNEARLRSTEEHDVRTGKIIRRVAADGSETVTVYDGLGRPLEIWGPNFESGKASFQESTTRYVEPVIDPDNPSASRPGYVVHEASGEAPLVTFYDGLGRELASKVLRETAAGLRALVTGLAGYNAAGQLVRSAVSFDAGGDAAAELESLPLPLYDAAPGWSQQSYEAVSGRLSESRRADGERTIYERRVPGVKAEGDAEFAAGSAKGNVRIEMFDAENHLVQVDRCAVMPAAEVLPAGCPDSALLARRSYEYDGLGRLVSIRQHRLESPPRAMKTTEYAYDGAGNKVSVFDIDSGEWIYVYNGAGLPTELHKPGGTAMFYEYDRGGRVETIREQAGLDSREIVYRYVRRGFGAGLLESATVLGPGRSEIDRQLSYNARGLITGESVAIHTASEDGEESDSHYAFSYGYELPNRRTTVSYPSGVEGISETIVTGYSAFGRPISMASTSPGGAVYVAGADYDVYGHLIRLHYGNGVTDLRSYRLPQYNGTLACLRTTTAPGDACSTLWTDYQALLYVGYNRRGQITGIIDRAHSYDVAYTDHHAAAYDRLGRLTDVSYATGLAADGETFAYDSLGNMSARNGVVRQFDAFHPHQLQAEGSRNFLYDADGNCIGKGGNESFSYDAGDRLRRMMRSGETVQENVFDESGHRAARIETHTTGTTHYYGDRFEVRLDDAEIVRHFHFGGRRVASDRVAVRTSVAQAPKQRVFYHPDHLGSPQVITDAAGRVVEYVRYRAYGGVRGVFVEQANGQIVAKPATGEPEPATNLAFTGQEADATTGLLYFGARFYDPALVRFLSRDREGQFSSPYAYAGFDPLNGIDPDGNLFGLDDAALTLLVKVAAVSAATAAAGTLVATGDLGAALQAGVVAGVSTFALGGAEAGTLRLLVDKEVISVTTAEIFNAAQIGYGAYRATRGDNPIADLVTLSTAAFSLADIASRHSALARQAAGDYARQGFKGSPTGESGAARGCPGACLPHFAATHLATADDARNQYAAYLKGALRVNGGAGVGVGREIGVFAEVNDGNVSIGYTVSDIRQVGSKGVEASLGVSVGPGAVTAGTTVELSLGAGGLARGNPGLVFVAPENGRGLSAVGAFYGTSSIPGATASRVETNTVERVFLHRSTP